MALAEQAMAALMTANEQARAYTERLALITGTVIADPAYNNYVAAELERLHNRDGTRSSAIKSLTTEVMLPDEWLEVAADVAAGLRAFTSERMTTSLQSTRERLGFASAEELIAYVEAADDGADTPAPATP